MPFSLDSLLGIHPQALEFRARRAELLAQNLANAETPHYKARDLDFATSLKQAQPAGEMKRTHERHFSGNDDSPMADALYRIPLHPSLDGNTVTEEFEKSAFSENAVRYQASLMFLTRKFSALKGAMNDQ